MVIMNWKNSNQAYFWYAPGYSFDVIFWIFVLLKFTCVDILMITDMIRTCHIKQLEVVQFCLTIQACHKCLLNQL